MPNPVEGLLEVYEDMVQVLFVLTNDNEYSFAPLLVNECAEQG